LYTTILIIFIVEKHNPWWVIIIAVISFSIAACQPIESSSTMVGFRNYEIDTLFNGLYSFLGGEEVLGPAISPRFNAQGLDYQYTATALFVYNPALPKQDQIKFASIGLEMGMADYSVHPESTDIGIQIYPGFLEFYNQLGGSRTVGFPITKVQYNNERGRLEQHFENLGFYQLDSDSKIRLLDYGAWLCASQCNFSTKQYSEVVLFSTAAQPFLDVTHSLDPEFIGRPLSNPHIAHDGNIQQIFHNVVLYTSTDNYEEVKLRPITTMLGIPTNINISHAVPEHFQKYLDNQKRLINTGSAITPYERQSDELYRQCFETLCLNFYPNNPISEQIKPLPLGYLYRNRYDQAEELNISAEELNINIVDSPPLGQAYTLNIWEEVPIIVPNSHQTIGASIFNEGIPIRNIEPILILKFPGSINITFGMPPSQENGISSLSLNPIDAPHGTVISYEVCIIPENRAKSCKNESFLIWGNP